MQTNNKIAVFVDVDNCGLDQEMYESLMSQIKQNGKIVYCKVYGVNDRKHAKIIEELTKNGYDDTRSLNAKSRKKSFDFRIAIDAIECALSHDINSVAIVCYAGDEIVHLYAKLASYGLKIIALNNCNEECMNYVDGILDIADKVVNTDEESKKVKITSAKPRNRTKQPAKSAASPAFEEILKAAAPKEDDIEETVENDVEESVENTTPINNRVEETFTAADFEEEDVEEIETAAYEQPEEETVADTLEQQPIEEIEEPVYEEDNETKQDLEGFDFNAFNKDISTPVTKPAVEAEEDEEDLLAEIKKLLQGYNN